MRPREERKPRAMARRKVGKSSEDKASSTFHAITDSPAHTLRLSHASSALHAITDSPAESRRGCEEDERST
eukprot:3937969-Rhodomonas_salina.1